jgi:ABC-2 type transport system permease protein
MSAAEVSTANRSVASRSTAGIGPAGGARPARRLVSTRLFRSELRLIFGRRRNQAGLAVLAAVPILIASAVRYSAPGPNDGPPFLGDITSNGLFVALVALTVELPLFLPLAVAAISGDAIAGEANLGTLRYLLTVPVHRGRLLAVKFAAVVTFCFAATLVVAVSGSVIGLILFPAGPVTLLSGSQISFWAALWRLVLVCAYVASCLVAVGAIGLFVSTLTEQPIGATIAVATLAITSEILDSVPQLASIHPYLFTHWWLAFGDLLRDPMATETIGKGLFSAAAYVAVFGGLAWARFSGKDVSS